LLRRLRDTDGEDRSAWFCGLLKNWHDGGIKLAVIQKLLQSRRDAFELFEKGSYEPLQIAETSALRLCGFRRTLQQETFVAIASLDARLKPGSYPEMSINLGGVDQQTRLSRLRDILTEKRIRAENGDVSVAEVFAVLPIAFLVPA
jgi:(1->4)-alpha-D-glucan 1-alpha-D-glucosylmutase